MKSVFLGAVPERPVSANPGLVLVHFLYLPSYALLRVTFYVIIFFGNKGTTVSCKLLLRVLRQENLA